MPISLRVLLVSIIPIVEMKGGIPFGVNQGLPVLEATVLGILGTSLQIPFNLLLIEVLMRLAHRNPTLNRFLIWSQARSHRHQALVHRWGMFGVAVLVGIPIPGTGLWTGTVAGKLIGLSTWPIVIGLVLGTIMAGVLVGLTTAGITLVF